MNDERKTADESVKSNVMKTYPIGTVRRLLATDAVTAQTREALEKRLRGMSEYQPVFFEQTAYETLCAVCARLIPQDAVNCAAFIDESLSENKGDGWRYDALPADAETFRGGLNGINETAQSKFDANFRHLNASRQDEILTEIQDGKAAGAVWKTLSAELFFEELLAKTVEVYYAHPLAQEEIGYVGMADAPGWTRIKLNELEPREPRVLGEKD
ncbi:MAG: gluconate 2-dehydrogenase subunit 3 family protein [Acidobacteriota bacterium]|nr:gluconate 2-dehydrogenase subunit 3 family protein [Acidobacteriota bacterium]